MNREFRVFCNWSLLYAVSLANNNSVPLTVVVSLEENPPGKNERQFHYQLEAIINIEQELKKFNIAFQFLSGKSNINLIRFLKQTKAGALVSDFNPLKRFSSITKSLLKDISIPFFEVDAHNIVPAWLVSDKEEYNAYTFRRKINPMLHEYLDDYPELSKVHISNENLEQTNWEKYKISKSKESIKHSSFIAGTKAGLKVLENFVENNLDDYVINSNKPNLAATSGLSPYLHFGFMSSQQIALYLMRNYPDNENRAGFLEQLIVRKELSDNYCYYNNKYESYEGFRNWAKITLEKHIVDNRDYMYSLDQLENAVTHDDLWNAAQNQMVFTGFMHGYMRMYWAKKILEWTISPEEAMSIAVYLNDKYSLDGNDPNGYVGCAWSIGGVHDRPWQERSVYGMIRYMNSNGCRRKFNVNAYISSINQIVNGEETNS